MILLKENLHINKFFINSSFDIEIQTDLNFESLQVDV